MRTNLPILTSSDGDMPSRGDTASQLIGAMRVKEDSDELQIGNGVQAELVVKAVDNKCLV